MALETTRSLTPVARTVVEVLVLIVVIALGAVESYRSLVPEARAAAVGSQTLSSNEAAELRREMRELGEKLDQVGQRLARIEGRTEVRNSGIGR